MILFVLATAALAIPPDSTPGMFPVGEGYISRMAVSADGSLVAGRDKGTMSGWLLDVDTWETQTGILQGECEVTGVAIIDFLNAQELWFSCKDGSIETKLWDGHDLTDIETLPSAIQVDEDGLSGIWYYFDVDLVVAQLYALTVADTEVRVHVIDLAGNVDASTYGAWPATVAYNSYNEAVISGDQLIINHSSSDMSRMQLPDGPISLVTFQQGGDLNFNIKDISPSPSGVYAVGGTGIAAELVWSFPTWATMFSSLVDPLGIAANLDPEDPWLVVTGEQVKVWELDSNFNIIGDENSPYFETAVDAGSKIQDSVVSDSYLFGGGTAGNLHIGTARPWVFPELMSVDPASPTEVTLGDVVTVSFTSNTSGDYEIRINGDRNGDGDLMASGSCTELVEEVVELEIDLSWEEGENDVIVIVEDNANITGHAAASVFVDNPPKPPGLTNAKLQFGDEMLFLRFPGIADADLSHYEVYITETEWSSLDWQDNESGGPDYVGDAGIKRKKFPIIIQAEPGEAVDKTLKPLENYVTYYVGVRAVDEGGLVGPMSNVISENPRPTNTAAALARENGGGPCSTTGTGVGWMALLLGGAAVLRRRSTPAMVAILGLALAAPAAQAQDQKGKREMERDLTPTYGDWEIRYGGITLVDKNINAVYKDNPANILQMEFGPQFFKVVEIDLGIGFFQELAFTIDDGGAQSGDRTMLTWYPFGLDATLRAHIIDEQFVVPYVRAGFDYVIWNEKWDAIRGDNKNVIGGSKFGNHWGAGVNILLDTFAKERASLLEATTGINDSYLVIEYRKQAIDQRGSPLAGKPTKVRGLNFAGSMFTLGLKLDY